MWYKDLGQIMVTLPCKCEILNGLWRLYGFIHIMSDNDLATNGLENQGEGDLLSDLTLLLSNRSIVY